MNANWKWLPSLGGSLLIAANSFASFPFFPNATRNTPAPAAPANAPREEQRQEQPLLERLTQLSQLIERNPQSPQLWQLHLEQSEVLLQLAVQSQEKEREGMLRMAVDACYAASLLCPHEQPIAMQRLRQLPQRLAQIFPGNPVALYAALQEIQADCILVMEQNGGDRVKSEEHRSERLLQFAQEHAEAPEAVKAAQQAAQIREALGETEEASHCYRYLAASFSNTVAGRKAEGALWRLGANHQPIELQLPLLYPSGSTTQNTFNIDELRGKVVIVYFWMSTSPSADQDFRTLKQLTDRYSGRGLEVVYVNMDADPAQGRAFLADRLTAGVHCHQAGGLDGPVAERYGLQEVPQAFLIGREGTVVKHSLQAAQLELALVGNVSHGH